MERREPKITAADLRKEGLGLDSIRKLRRLQDKIWAENGSEFSQEEKGRLRFTRWLVTTGRLSDQIKNGEDRR